MRLLMSLPRCLDSGKTFKSSWIPKTRHDKKNQGVPCSSQEIADYCTRTTYSYTYNINIILTGISNSYSASIWMDYWTLINLINNPVHKNTSIHREAEFSCRFKKKRICSHHPGNSVESQIVRMYLKWTSLILLTGSFLL